MSKLNSYEKKLIKLLKDGNKIELIKNKAKQYARERRTVSQNSFWYSKCYKKEIIDNLVFVESRDGLDFAGNMFRIVEELAKPEYSFLSIVVLARNDVKKQIKNYSKHYSLGNISFVETVDDAIPIMEQAKYIVSDSGVPWQYVKRDGQIVLNTWHGTPFKVMGRRITTEKHAIGTVQHFFLSTDYFVYPNKYMMKVMQEDYMVENLCKGKVLLTGYPRNAIFFDHKRSEILREELGLKGKKVYAYLPTHRSNNGKNNKQLEDVTKYLTELDAWLGDDQVVLVKLHVLNQSKIYFPQFEHIKPFPADYETYDVLNSVDALITDYSSVFFDFANTGKKIILFTYDEEEYDVDRGSYFPIEKLPFPRVKTVRELLDELSLPKNYNDKSFIEEYCTFDCVDATSKLCRHVFLNDKCLSETTLGNGKENILIMGGSLAKNGITTALLNLLYHLDKEEKNYYVTFWRTEINQDPTRVDKLPSNVSYVPFMCDPYFTRKEKAALDQYSRQIQYDAPFPKILNEAFDRELKRYFYGAKFSHVIQFDGYGKLATMLFSRIQAEKTIFVHNDMVREIKDRNIQHGPTLHWAYSLFDHVAIVSPDLYAPTLKISGNANNIVVVNNCEIPESVLKRAEQPIEFQKDKVITTSNPGGIIGVLEGKDKVFITIGRFSAEKGHEKLIKAFDIFCKEYPNTQLIIIGGHGNLYDETLLWRERAKYKNNITIIKSILNPMPILKRCDLFILPSLYEGLPMTIKEADILGKPVIATDIPGPHSFLLQHGGYLCEGSIESIVNGMKKYMKGEIHPMNIDYVSYNKQAIDEFNSLFRKDKSDKSYE